MVWYVNLACAIAGGAMYLIGYYHGRHDEKKWKLIKAGVIKF